MILEDFGIDGEIVTCGIPYRGRVDNQVITLPITDPENPPDPPAFTFQSPRVVSGIGIKMVNPAPPDPLPTTDLDVSRGFTWDATFVADRGLYGLSDLQWIMFDDYGQAWRMRAQMSLNSTTNVFTINVYQDGRHGVFGNYESSSLLLWTNGGVDKTADWRNTYLITEVFTTGRAIVSHSSDGRIALVHVLASDTQIEPKPIWPVEIYRVTLTGNPEPVEDDLPLSVLVTLEQTAVECRGQTWADSFSDNCNSISAPDIYEYDYTYTQDRIFRCWLDENATKHTATFVHRFYRWEERGFGGLESCGGSVRERVDRYTRILSIDGTTMSTWEIESAINYTTLAEATTYTFDGVTVYSSSSYITDANLGTDNMWPWMYDARTVGIVWNWAGDTPTGNSDVGTGCGDKHTDNASVLSDDNPYAAYDWYTTASIVTSANPVAFI